MWARETVQDSDTQYICSTSNCSSTDHTWTVLEFNLEICSKEPASFCRHLIEGHWGATTLSLSRHKLHCSVSITTQTRTVSTGLLTYWSIVSEKRSHWTTCMRDKFSCSPASMLSTQHWLIPFQLNSTYVTVS